MSLSIFTCQSCFFSTLSIQEADILEKLACCPCIALGAQVADKNRTTAPPENVICAVIDSTGSVPSSLLKKAQKTMIWLLFNEKSVRDRKKLIRGTKGYTQQLQMTLYGEKAALPEKERMSYPGYSSGDCIGFITMLPPDKMWRLPRLGIFSKKTKESKPFLNEIFFCLDD